MGSKSRVVVMGGGVIGAVTAVFLRRRGLEVVVLERGRFGGGASHGNCGLIVPDHVFPLNSVGNLWTGLRWMIRRDAPLLIRPRPDRIFIAWMARFVRGCGPRRVAIAAAGRAALLHDAIALHRSLVREGRLACHWAEDGALHLFSSRSAFGRHAREAAALRRFGLRGGRPLEGEALVRAEPAVGGAAVAAWLSPQVASLRPDHLMESLRRHLLELGVAIRERTEVTGFRTRGGRAVAALTPGGSVAGEHFVVATGAWTPLLGRALGCRLPIQPGKGYATVLRDPSGHPSRPCFFKTEKVVATPHPRGLRLGGTMEFAGYDERLRRERLAPLYRAARRYLNRLRCDGVEEEWCGWRPMTCDGLPVVDRSPRCPNVIIAAGHNMEGLSMAPRTAGLVAEMVAGETPHVDLRPYRVARFGTARTA